VHVAPPLICQLFTIRMPTLGTPCPDSMTEFVVPLVFNHKRVHFREIELVLARRLRHCGRRSADGVDSTELWCACVRRRRRNVRCVRSSSFRSHREVVWSVASALQRAIKDAAPTSLAHSDLICQCEYIYTSASKHVWTRKGRQRTRQGRRQASSQGPSRQHPGHHKAGNPSSCPSWWCEAYLGSDLRGDPRRAEGVPRERHPRRRDVHRTRQAKDRDGHGRRLRSEAPGPHPVRLRRISCRADELSGGDKSALFRATKHTEET